jgi:hypothetical protein
MKETRQYWDGSRQWTVNLRTGVASYVEDGQTVYPDKEMEARIVAKVRGRVKSTTRRAAMDDAYRSCGMVKVRGALGGTYWE